MSVAIEELREWAQYNAVAEAENTKCSDPEFEAHYLHVVDALDELAQLSRVVDLFVYRTNNMVHELASLKRELGQ